MKLRIRAARMGGRTAQKILKRGDGFGVQAIRLKALAQVEKRICGLGITWGATEEGREGGAGGGMVAVVLLAQTLPQPVGRSQRRWRPGGRGHHGQAGGRRFERNRRSKTGRCQQPQQDRNGCAKKKPLPRTVKGWTPMPACLTAKTQRRKGRIICVHL